MDKFKAMNTFVGIVEAGSLTAAADRLGVSLAAVVRSLAALEESLGVRLLNRSTRRIALTEEGRDYLERSRRLLADLADMENAVTARRTRPSGRLVITAPVMFGRLHVVPVLCEFLQISALLPYPRHQQKMIGHHSPDLVKLFGVGGANHKHEVVRIAPVPGFAQDFFKERPPVFLRGHLKIGAAFVGSQSQQNDPFVFKLKERQHRIFAHIRRYGHRVEVHRFKKGFGVHAGSITNIAAFGVCNGKMGIGQIVEGFFQRLPAFFAQRFVKSSVQFISDAKIAGRINDLPVELENGIGMPQQVWRQFLQVGV